MFAISPKGSRYSTLYGILRLQKPYHIGFSSPNSTTALYLDASGHLELPDGSLALRNLQVMKICMSMTMTV